MFSNGYPYTDFHELNADWLVRNFKTFLNDLSSLNDWRITHEAEYQQLKEMVDALMAGFIPENVYEQLRQWFLDNAFDLVGEMVKHVYFGLTDTGYFVVTIPTSWRDLIFNTTGYDIEVALQPEYGHLTLSY